MSAYWHFHLYRTWQCHLWRKGSERMWFLLDVASFCLSEKALQNEVEWCPASPLLWFCSCSCHIPDLGKINGTKRQLSPKAWRDLIVFKSLNLGYFDLKHASKYLNSWAYRNPLFGGFFFLPLGFLQQEILNVKKKVPCYYPNYLFNDTSSNADDIENHFISATASCVLSRKHSRWGRTVSILLIFYMLD